MLESRCHEKWCHRSMVVVQRGQTGQTVQLQTIPVSYNRSTTSVHPLDDEVIGKHCTCIGSECANWEGSAWNILCWIPVVHYFWPPMGRCRG